MLNEPARSAEHTSALQSRFELVCRLLLENSTVSPATALVPLSSSVIVRALSLVRPPQLSSSVAVFCSTDTALTVFYTLSLHDALPIYVFENVLWLPAPSVIRAVRS